MSKDKETTRLDEMTIAEYKALPVEEQRKIEYQMVVDTFFNRAKEEAATSIDVFEQLSVINDTNRGTANRERHLGWLLALATCLEQSSGVQARQELQASFACGKSRYGLIFWRCVRLAWSCLANSNVAAMGSRSSWLSLLWRIR